MRMGEGVSRAPATSCATLCTTVSRSASAARDASSAAWSTFSPSSRFSACGANVVAWSQSPCNTSMYIDTHTHSNQELLMDKLVLLQLLCPLPRGLIKQVLERESDPVLCPAKPW
jgi:hypothetical protein